MPVKLRPQRRCTLEDWMAKVLSDMDFSRSAPVACFLELEAAARSCMCSPSYFFGIPHNVLSALCLLDTVDVHSRYLRKWE